MQKENKWEPEKSRVKLVVYDRNNSEKTFYSYPKDDRKGVAYIVESMKKRLLKKYYQRKFNSAIFYDTRSDSEITRVTSADFVKSKVKLVVFSDNGRREFWSLASEETMSVEFTVGAMSHRILMLVFNNHYKVAIFYDVQSGQEITRLSPYGSIVKNVAEALV
ncbi:MAG: hypothetical protein JXR50_06340 [Prolixibacteraceae bacterium]|nr:hypothetical protein [Prolixibacteraceae bacterium]